MERVLKHIYFVIILLIVSFISSCSSHIKRDGPPPFYVDETKVPNATPKPEPLAKYGNMPSYRVFGKRYYTMKSSKNYQAVGVASWYGLMFHKRNTSSGEPYDLAGMTAAHKTLPLPTYVEVVNLKNHRRIIVKVNDRGPFESDRLIDLSYVAAKKLGMLGKGTAPVKITAIDPTMPLSRPQLNSIPSLRTLSQPGQFHGIYLQVGAFRDKMRAIQLQQKLSQELAFPVKVLSGHLYRVHVGPLNDAASANALSLRLKALGLPANKTYGV